MRTPICSFDARTGILCPKCETRLRSGQITKTDVDASVKLSKLAERAGDLNRVTLNGAMEIDGDIVLVLSAGDLAILRRDHGLIEQIEREMGAKTWFVEAETSDRRMLEDLFYPTRILTVNVVWLPDGSKLTKVIVPSKKGRPRLNVDKLKGLAKAVRGIDLLVEFER